MTAYRVDFEFGLGPEETRIGYVTARPPPPPYFTPTDPTSDPYPRIAHSYLHKR